jgi:hypothetical protein
MCDTLRRRRVLTVGELPRQSAEIADETEVDPGSTLSGVPLRWYGFDQAEGLLKVELIEEFLASDRCR